MAKRTRQNDLHIYLNDAEAAVLQTLCDKTKKPKSAVVRQLIQNECLAEATPADFKAFTVDLRRIITDQPILQGKVQAEKEQMREWYFPSRTPEQNKSRHRDDGAR